MENFRMVKPPLGGQCILVPFLVNSQGCNGTHFPLINTSPLGQIGGEGVHFPILPGYDPLGHGPGGGGGVYLPLLSGVHH